jgi:ABC-type nitrate/sulfonate/bicarbonate transport system ATPase subunit
VNAVAAQRASGIMALDRVASKSAVVVADVETTTSPVSGKEMRYSAKDKNVEVVTSKLQDERITPWASVSPAAKLKILERELAAGGDRKAIARVAREAGLTDFADSIEKR